MPNNKIRQLAPSELFELHNDIHAEMERREEIEDKLNRINKLLKSLMDDLESGETIEFTSNQTGEIIDIVTNENDCAPQFNIYWG